MSDLAVAEASLIAVIQRLPCINIRPDTILLPTRDHVSLKLLQNLYPNSKIYSEAVSPLKFDLIVFSEIAAEGLLLNLRSYIASLKFMGLLLGAVPISLKDVLFDIMQTVQVIDPVFDVESLKVYRPKGESFGVAKILHLHLLGPACLNVECEVEA